MKIHTILLAAAIALVTAPSAHADDTDDAYLSALRSRGITNQGGDQEEIQLAHDICAMLGGGLTMDGVADNFELHERNGMTDDDMKFLVKTSAASYCPQYIQ